jgi:hypothetical protein
MRDAKGRRQSAKVQNNATLTPLTSHTGSVACKNPGPVLAMYWQAFLRKDQTQASQQDVPAVYWGGEAQGKGRGGDERRHRGGGASQSE